MIAGKLTVASIAIIASTMLFFFADTETPKSTVATLPLVECKVGAFPLDTMK